MHVVFKRIKDKDILHLAIWFSISGRCVAQWREKEEMEERKRREEETRKSGRKEGRKEAGRSIIYQADRPQTRTEKGPTHTKRALYDRSTTRRVPKNKKGDKFGSGPVYPEKRKHSSPGLWRS